MLSGEERLSQKWADVGVEIIKMGPNIYGERTHGAEAACAKNSSISAQEASLSFTPAQKRGKSAARTRGGDKEN